MNKKIKQGLYSSPSVAVEELTAGQMLCAASNGTEQFISEETDWFIEK